MKWRSVIRVSVMGIMMSGPGLPAFLPAQNPAAPTQQKPTPSLPTDPNQFVRQAIYHSMDAEKNDHTRWRYLFHREDDKNNYDRDVVETRDGDLARTLLVRG